MGIGLALAPKVAPNPYNGEKARDAVLTTLSAAHHVVTSAVDGLPERAQAYAKQLGAHVGTTVDEIDTDTTITSPVELRRVFNRHLGLDYEGQAGFAAAAKASTDCRLNLS